MQQKIEIKKTENLLKREDSFGGNGFAFGSEFFNTYSGPVIKSSKVLYNPDLPNMLNGSIAITGGSGSGKTRTTLDLVQWLGMIGKTVYVMDFHGEMQTPGETVYKFTARNSQYGFNPFVFEEDPENGGPNVQAEYIVDLFKKTYIPNMGPVQRSVLKRLLGDTYRFVGILDEDISTWIREVPSIKTLKEAYELIMSSCEDTAIDGVKKDFEKLVKKRHNFSNALETSEDPDGATERYKESVNGKLDEIAKTLSDLKEYLLLEKEDEVGQYGKELPDAIDVTYYKKAKNFKALEGLMPYIEEVASISALNGEKPPATSGVIRYDMSGLTNMAKPTQAIFLSDVLCQGIFRAYKMNHMAKPQAVTGIKTKAFIVIDESKLVLPNGAEKNDSFNIFNRIISESRKFFLSLILVTQSPGSFSPTILANIFTKIVLRTNSSDTQDVKKLFGVKGDDMLESLKYKGSALVGFGSEPFKSVALPWFGEGN